jgi:oxygen-dependent protoporphyrinogen oxidase
MPRVQALVVGGGISGLVCAYALRKAGLDAHVFEASPRPGGLIQSIARDGFLLELGPQSFSGTAPLRALFQDLGISGQIVQAPARAPRYVLVDGALRPVPLSPPAFFTSSLINGSTKWALVRDLVGKSVPPDADESVAAFVRRKFSQQLLDRLVVPSFPACTRAIQNVSVCAALSRPSTKPRNLRAASFGARCAPQKRKQVTANAPHS